MLATVDDVHHRSRQQIRTDAAQVPVQWLIGVLGGRLGDRHRDAENRVGAQLLLVGRVVEFDHGHVDAGLIQRVHADQAVGDLVVHVIDGLEYAFAQVDRLVAVTQFPRFVDAGAGTAGHRSPSGRAIAERDVHFDGRIAAAVENLAAVHVE